MYIFASIFCVKMLANPITLLLFCLHFPTVTLSAWNPFHRKALVCSKMLFLYLSAMLMGNTNLSLCLESLLAVTAVSSFSFYRLHITHLVPQSHSTKSLHLLMVHCPLPLYPQVNNSLVCLPKLHHKLMTKSYLLYFKPANHSSHVSHSLQPDSTVN